MKSFRAKSLSLFHTIMNLKHINLFILLLLLLLCLGIRLINFVGIGINDDIAYLHDARCLASVGCSPISSGFNQLGFRLGMVFPLALLYKLFGYNELGFSLYPLLSSLLTCALIYLTALKLWGRPAAVFASLLWIFYPLQIVFDTQLVPSNQHATCVIAALFLYFCAVPRKNSIYESQFDFSSKWKEPVLLISSGVCLGIAWWMNEIFVTFIFAMIPFLLILRPKIKNLTWILIGFLLIISIELLIVKFSSGSWFARFTCILKTESAVESNKDTKYLLKALFKLWNIDFLNSEGHFGIIWYLFIGATILTVFLKDKIPLSLALGSWLWLFYLQWGIQSPEGTPIAKYIRYISMIVPLQCLTFGALLKHFMQYSKKLKAVIISLFIVLLVHLFYSGTSAVKMVRIRTEDFKEITKILLDLKLKKDDVIYTDDLTANFIKVYSKDNLTIKNLNHSGMNNPPEEGIVIVDGSWYVAKLDDYRMTIPAWFSAPIPPQWQLLYTVPGKNIGDYKDFDPKIYRIIPQYY
jgi:hypothetical protein